MRRFDFGKASQITILLWFCVIFAGSISLALTYSETSFSFLTSVMFFSTPVLLILAFILSIVGIFKRGIGLFTYIFDVMLLPIVFLAFFSYAAYILARVNWSL